MNELVFKEDVLDHGYVKLIEAWGSDARIIEAARMSTDKGFEGWGPRCKVCKRPLGGSSNWIRCPNEACEDAGVESGDEKLLKYLYENKHATPFEFAGLVIEVQAPIFVFREWHRHRTQAFNEMSARYVPLPDVNYIPSIERLMMTGGTNKQAGTLSGARQLDEAACHAYRDMLEETYSRAEHFYQWALKEGVPKELARIHLPVGRYSRMRAQTCLRNWLAFLTLRQAPTAQYEIRMFANVVGQIIRQLFPRTWEIYELERQEVEEFKAWKKNKKTT